MNVAKRVYIIFGRFNDSKFENNFYYKFKEIYCAKLCIPCYEFFFQNFSAFHNDSLRSWKMQGFFFVR